MMQQLLTWDADLLLWINGHNTPFWDTVMWYTSQSYVWIPLYLLLIYLLYSSPKTSGVQWTPMVAASLRGWEVAAGRRSTIIVFAVLIGFICIAASAGMADFITSGLMKKSICRLRPTHSDLASLIHLVNGYKGGMYGFPSSHAANCWAVATSFIVIYRSLLPQVLASRSRIVLPCLLVICYALINCYSRMYLGVHYPLDILCGTVIGVLLGLGFGTIFKIFLPKIKTARNKTA